MNFTFGSNTSGLGATSTPAKPTFPFGNTATNPAPAFGQSATTTSVTPAFGATSFGAQGFGATASTTGFGASVPSTGFGGTAPGGGFGATAIGTGFGATAPGTGFGATAPGTGFGATAPATGFGATAPATGFGATAPATGFGATAPATGFGAAAPGTGFGATAPGAGFGTSTSTGGFGGFGTNTATTSAPTLGGFGTFGATTTTTSAPSLFGNTSTGFGGFGSTATTSTAPTFGGFGTSSGLGFGGFGTTTTTSSLGFGGFGTATTSAPSFSNFSSFGSTFGKPATTTATGFSGFGTTFPLGQPQGQQQQQLQLTQQPQLSPDEVFAQSVFNVSIYGDERDTILAKLNYLQAMWGIGKCFYSQSAPPVEINPHNYLCRFKSMSYNLIPGKDNKEGCVGLHFQKPLSEVKAQQQTILNAINTALGSKPNFIIHVDGMQEKDEKNCRFVIKVEEKAQTGSNESKYILATELANFLNQQHIKPHLVNLGVEDIVALIPPDENQLKEYTENPPKGVDPRMWRQANIDNPDPKKFIPVPIIGFQDLRMRIKYQENETNTHGQYLSRMEQDLGELKQRHVATTAKIEEHKRKLVNLTHRLLKIIVKQECSRKVGIALSAEEEALRSKLENMQNLISAPTHFKGRLSELLSQMRMQKNQYVVPSGAEIAIDKECAEEMQSFLEMQQNAMEVLVDTVNRDLKALQIILEGLPELITS